VLTRDAKYLFIFNWIDITSLQPISLKTVPAKNTAGVVGIRNLAPLSSSSSSSSSPSLLSLSSSSSLSSSLPALSEIKCSDIFISEDLVYPAVNQAIAL
jgi:hypothetical protein